MTVGCEGVNCVQAGVLWRDSCVHDACSNLTDCGETRTLASCSYVSYRPVQACTGLYRLVRPMQRPQIRLPKLSRRGASVMSGRGLRFTARNLPAMRLHVPIGKLIAEDAPQRLRVGYRLHLALACSRRISTHWLQREVPSGGVICNNSRAGVRNIQCASLNVCR